jgi:hypothetical protein
MPRKLCPTPIVLWKFSIGTSASCSGTTRRPTTAAIRRPRPGEFHPGERIGREGRDQDRDDRGRDRHGQRVDEGPVHVVGEEHGVVVRGGELRRRARLEVDARAGAVDLLGLS